jgi:hypothetical protein
VVGVSDQVHVREVSGIFRFGLTLIGTRTETGLPAARIDLVDQQFGNQIVHHFGPPFSFCELG